MPDFHLSIADFVIRIASVDPGLPLVPAAGSAPFVVEARPPDVTVQVVVGAPHDSGSRRVFDSGGTWQLFRTDDGSVLTFRSDAFGADPYKTARMNPAGTEIEVRLNPRDFGGGRAVDALEYPLDELIVIHLLAAGRGLEIHGCGVRDADGAGYLFAGQSGAGKTTIARLWTAERGATVLSDDRVIVRQDEDGFWLHGTPWHGEAPLASPDRARLAQVFLLRQHADHELRAIPRAAAAARLFAASFPPFHDASALAFTLRFLDALTAGVPSGELGFAPAASLPGFVRCLASKHRRRN
jgi:hypothetical protein